MSKLTRMLAGVAAVAAVVGSMTGASAAQNQDAVTMTGCLRSGSASDVLVLRGATDGSPGSIARDYLLVRVPGGTADRVNHKLAVTGTVHTPDTAPDPPSGANSAERALRRLAVSGVQEVAANCDGEAGRPPSGS